MESQNREPVSGTGILPVSRSSFQPLLISCLSGSSTMPVSRRHARASWPLMESKQPLRGRHNLPIEVRIYRGIVIAKGTTFIIPCRGAQALARNRHKRPTDRVVRGFCFRTCVRAEGTKVHNQADDGLPHRLGLRGLAQAFPHAVACSATSASSRFPRAKIALGHTGKMPVPQNFTQAPLTNAAHRAEHTHRPQKAPHSKDRRAQAKGSADEELRPCKC